MLTVKRSDKVQIRISDRAMLRFKRGWVIVNEEGMPMKTDGQFECYSTRKIAWMQADYLNRS